MELLSAIQAIDGAAGAIRGLFAPRRPPVNVIQLDAAQSKGFASMLQQQMDPVRQAESRADLMLSRLDSDRDGFLNAGETGLSKEVFQRLDLNGDGRLDRAEIVQGQLARAFDGVLPELQ